MSWSGNNTSNSIIKFDNLFCIMRLTVKKTDGSYFKPGSNLIGHVPVGFIPKYYLDIPIYTTHGTNFEHRAGIKEVTGELYIIVNSADVDSAGFIIAYPV